MKTKLISKQSTTIKQEIPKQEQPKQAKASMVNREPPKREGFGRPAPAFPIHYRQNPLLMHNPFMRNK